MIKREKIEEFFGVAIPYVKRKIKLIADAKKELDILIEPVKEFGRANNISESELAIFIDELMAKGVGEENSMHVFITCMMCADRAGCAMMDILSGKLDCKNLFEEKVEVIDKEIDSGAWVRGLEKTIEKKGKL